MRKKTQLQLRELIIWFFIVLLFTKTRFFHSLIAHMTWGEIILALIALRIVYILSCEALFVRK